MRWFELVQHQPTTAPLRKGFSIEVDGPPRRRGRLKRTSMEVLRIDLRKCNLSEDLAQDRLEWRNKIHVIDPNIVGTRL